MKILYVANEREAAIEAADALHAVASNVTLTWAQTLGSAVQWAQENPDAAAVIVDGDVQGRSCASFVKQVRGLGLTTPVVVVVASAQLERALAALHAGADGYVLAGPSLKADLPRFVAVAIERERSRRTDLAETLTDVQARHHASLAREARICTALQQRLLELESALRNADERRASDAGAFADQLAKRHAEFTASLADTVRSRDALASQLSVATAARDDAQQARRADAAAVAERLGRREAELGAALAESVAARSTVEGALAQAESAHRDARRRAELDLAAANERQAAIEDLLAQEADRRTGLDQELAAAATARAALEQRLAAAVTELEQVTRERTSDAAVAAEHLARREAELGAQRAEVTAARDTLERALTEAQSAHQHASNRAAADLASAATALDTIRARYDAAVTEHAAACAAFEQQLIDAVAARQQADQRAVDAVAAATARDAEAVARLTTESAARAALERDLAGLRMESARRRRRSLRVVLASRPWAREQKARLEAQLDTTREELRRLHSTVDEERQDYARARLTSESELQRVAAEFGQLRQAFDQLQAAFQALEHVAGEHAAERARLGSVVAERDAQLSVQAERHVLAEQVAHDALTLLQERLRQTLEANGSDIARLQREIDVVRRDLDATQTHAEALRGVAERVPDLQAQLERSEKERRGQFERAPYGLCRCTEAGVITDANHAFAMLLGHRRADQLLNADFAAAVFDRAGDVRWLLERTRTMRKAEPVETCWKTPDGRHLIVRLQALATTTGSVEIVVEDITGFRALEDRLRQAQRMEAVGRLASEVAVTCDALLRDVARDAGEWLATIASDDVLRRRGEILLADLARAAGFLRQLGTYGDRQVRAHEPVSVQRVLGELAPVLKSVAGDAIELVLPKASGSFDVDVEAERLERVLVNVASYARQRMPHGGQVRIDLATTVVGRRFIAGYLNMRPGAHVLITVTERPGAGELHGGTERRPRSTYKPGVDLGALVDLIGTCGGHLWMEAQPAGNMVVKIHLPKPATAGATDPRGPGACADRRGRLARWSRTRPAGVVRS